MFMKLKDILNEIKLDELYKIANSFKKISVGDIVDGLEVLDGIPNLSSINASLDDYKSFGLREVPMNIFKETKGSPDLAEKIKNSKKIKPLIVVLDRHPDGIAYILEGSHRIDALFTLNKKYCPALVIVDNDEF